MRQIFQSPIFKSRLVKFIGRHPELERDIQKTLRLLQTDTHFPSLKTHKLHGPLAGSYGASINYHYRLVFSFDDGFIYPESIGSHDDVY